MSLRSKTTDFYLGEYDNCYSAYSNNENIRKNAASGGMTTQLITHLLNNNIIDGAILSRLKIKNGDFLPESFIATTEEKVKSCQSSIYIDFPLIKNLTEIENFNGRLAIVGLPCQLNVINKLKNKNNIIKIGLFCGHTSKKKLIENVLKEKIDLMEVEEFCFRAGHWRGQSRLKLKSGEEKTFPYFDFGMFQNLFFQMPKKCLYCRDHTAETSDVSFGDIWLKEFKKKKIKHSLIISRKKEITNVLNEMKEAGMITLNTLEPEKAINSQKRPLIYHKFTTSAVQKIKTGSSELEYNWNDLFAAYLILFNMNISEKEASKIFYKLPKKIVFLYMVFVRVFLSF